MTVTPRHQQKLWVADSYRAMRTAIGWQLQMRYEPPKELPAELIDLMAAMDQPRESGQ
jgi:hypothetical protein